MIFKKYFTLVISYVFLFLAAVLKHISSCFSILKKNIQLYLCWQFQKLCPTFILTTIYEVMPKLNATCSLLPFSISNMTIAIDFLCISFLYRFISLKRKIKNGLQETISPRFFCLCSPRSILYAQEVLSIIIQQLTQIKRTRLFGDPGGGLRQRSY